MIQSRRRGHGPTRLGAVRRRAGERQHGCVVGVRRARSGPEEASPNRRHDE